MADLEATSMHTATCYQLAVDSVRSTPKLCVAKKIIVCHWGKDSFKGKKLVSMGAH